MRALITGANGHIGSHVVRAVIDAGWTPIAFVRDGSDRRALAGLDLELRSGDLLDANSLERAMSGIDILFHVGAAHRNYDPDPARIMRPAVEGTRNALAAARRCGVKRMIYTSTGATVGFAKDPSQPFDESHSLPSARSAYIQGKIAAEKVVLDAAASGEAPEVVILHPSGVFGPLDYRLTPATRAIVGLLQGDPSFLHICLTDVRDVARAHVLAATQGRSGNRYLITGDNQSPNQLAALFQDVAGIRPATFRPPRFLLRLIGALAVRKARRTGEDAPFDPAAIADLDGGHLAYDSTRSRRDLGMSYRAAREVLTDAVRWLLHVKALKPRIAERVRTTLGERAAPDPSWR